MFVLHWNLSSITEQARCVIKREQARKYLIKARVYNILALVFAAIGLILFVFMYLRYIEGDFYRAIQDPSIILFLIIPFVPAVSLSFLASRLEKKLMRYIESDRKK